MLNHSMRFFLVSIACSCLISCSYQTKDSSNNEVEYPLKPRLITPIKFAEFTVNSLDDVQDVSTLLDAKISVGNGEGQSYEFMRLKENDPDSYLSTQTANEYFDAIKRDAFPMTTYDITMDSWFVQVVPVLEFIKQARPSKQSLMVDELIDLSVQVIPYIGIDEKKRIEEDSAASLTLSDYVERGVISLNKGDSDNEISFNTKSLKIFITEHARGDYNHDGYEDSLISIAMHYLQGSGRNYYASIVLKTPEQSVMKIDDFILPQRQLTN